MCLRATDTPHIGGVTSEIQPYLNDGWTINRMVAIYAYPLPLGSIPKVTVFISSILETAERGQPNLPGNDSVTRAPAMGNSRVPVM